MRETRETPALPELPARPGSARQRLGATEVEVAPIAVGTWAWGERRYWGYEKDFAARDVVDAFAASADAGLELFDTAEVYGDGESEKILGWLARKRGGRILLATKFGLLPGRDARTLPRALDASLKRLGVPRVDLYQIHWPDRTMASIDALMGGLADAVAAGKARAVGVSNFGAGEMREAHQLLARRGVPLASNQVRYSLIHRAPEVDGVLDACRELGVTLLAYSPLGQGILSGKYGADHPPAGPRAGHPEFATESLAATAPLLALLRGIGAAHGGRPPEQAALAWLRAKAGVLPIAGAKTGAQAAINAGALDLTLGAGDVEALDRASERWRAQR
jgi:aryl-alcohol dehydrogenase-like predicted oxidoreductase